VGKEISQAFYNKTHTKSYYLGCSTGGRQGFKSAQMFPDDFDGIVAGSPALRFNYLNSWSGIFYPIIRDAGKTGFPPPTAFTTIDESILSQCDMIDGAADGIVTSPDLCVYRPEAIECTSATQNQSTCVTGAQAESIRQIFSDLYGVNGTFIYPHMQIAPGVLDAVYGIYAAAQFPYTVDWFKYAIMVSFSNMLPAVPRQFRLKSPLSIRHHANKNGRTILVTIRTILHLKTGRTHGTRIPE
jgi:feruloyl esterase